MWSAEVRGNILDIGAAKLVDKHTQLSVHSKVYVRECYDTLYALITEARRMSTNVVITGTPGTGKTAYRNYVIWKLAQEMKRTGNSFAIILDGTPGNTKLCVVLTAVKNPCDKSLQLHAKVVKNETGWLMPMEPYRRSGSVYLVDVSEGDSKGMLHFAAGSTIMFTSPNRSAWHDFQKEDLFNGGPLYMPLWSETELRAAATMLGVKQEGNFNEAVRRYGGVPRAVFQSSLDPYEVQTRDSLQQMKWAECTEGVDTASATVGVRHKLLYFFAATDLKSAQLAFGTDYLLRAAADKYIRTMVNAITQVIQSPWPGVTPGVAGMFMEDVYHSLLC